MSERFIVYRGNGHRRLKAFASRSEAEKFAADFEQRCWSGGVPVPRSQIEEDVM